MSIDDRIRIQSVETLSDDWYVLKKATLDWQRSDGSWQRFSRESYNNGDAAAILPFDPIRRVVTLVRQFRYPAYVMGYNDLMIEVPAGLLDGDRPEESA